jgi:outer membrane protein assembly factor BamE (lipoprotein component of BamABCDE complex)
MKSLKKVVLLGVATTSIFSACSTKEQANYEPYKKHDSVETEKGEEETSNPTKVEKIDEEPAKDAKPQQVEESTKEDSEVNDRRPYYKDANNDAPTVSLEQYDGIKVGMSANKVKEIAGTPRFIEKYKSFSIYGYLGYGGEGSMTITFNPDGSVTKKAQDGLRNTAVKDAKANEDRATGNPKPATKSSTKIPNDYCGHGHDETKELAHDCEKIIDKEAHRRHLEQQEREYEEQQREEAKKYQSEMTEEDKARILRQEKRWNTPSGGIGGTWQDEMKEMEEQEAKKGAH